MKRFSVHLSRVTRKTRLVALLVISIVALALAGCGGSSSSSGAASNQTERASGGSEEGEASADKALTVGSDIPYPPFEQGKAGEYTGFDIELMEAICKKIGRTPEFEDGSGETMYRDVGQGKYEAVISASTITEEREKAVDFSNPYYESQQAVLVREGSPIKSLKELEGKTVGVQQGTTSQTLAKEELSSAEIRPFQEGPDTVNALKSGTVEGVIIDAPLAQDAVEKSGGIEIVEEVPTEEQYGIVVPQGSTELLDEINKGLKEVEEDGTYTKIYEKWFHEAPPQSIFGATHQAE